MKYTKFSHKTPHLKGKQHQLDPNLDLKQLVHHATVQYVDRDNDGDVDVYDNPKKGIPDENVSSAQDAQKMSNRLIAKQKGEIKHSKKRIAYESNTSLDIEEGSLHKWFKSSSSKDGKPGWVNVVTGGTCASDEPGEGTPKCVSSSKRASMTKAERLSASKRKKAADPGQQMKSNAAKPTYVPTDKPKKKMKEQTNTSNKVLNEREWDEPGEPRGTQRQKVDPEAWEKSRKQWEKIHPHIYKPKPQQAKKKDKPETQLAHHELEGQIIDESDVKGKGSGKKDACYRKVKSRYDVWPSAYASGALVKCRKVGAKNWGNKSEGLSPIAVKILNELNLDEVSFEIGSGHKAAQKTQKIYNKAKEGAGTEKDWLKKTGPQLPLANEYVPEDMTRINANGQTYSVVFMWRGKTYTFQMFIPSVRRPNISDINAEINKIYPGSKVMYFSPKMFDPTDPTIMLKVEEYSLDEASPAWQRKEGKNPEGGLNKKGIESYRRENPGSKLSMAVTTPPSKLDPDSKAAKRRKSFCARMGGNPGPMKDEKGRPTRKALALRKWNC